MVVAIVVFSYRKNQVTVLALAFFCDSCRYYFYWIGFVSYPEFIGVSMEGSSSSLFVMSAEALFTVAGEVTFHQSKSVHVQVIMSFSCVSSKI